MKAIKVLLTISLVMNLGLGFGLKNVYDATQRQKIMNWHFQEKIKENKEFSGIIVDSTHKALKVVDTRIKELQEYHKM